MFGAGSSMLACYSQPWRTGWDVRIPAVPVAIMITEHIRLLSSQSCSLLVILTPSQQRKGETLLSEPLNYFIHQPE